MASSMDALVYLRFSRSFMCIRVRWRAFVTVRVRARSMNRGAAKLLRAFKGQAQQGPLPYVPAAVFLDLAI